MSIPNKFLKFIAVIFATSFMSSIANAAVVTADNSVTFKFDVSQIGQVNVDYISWYGGDTPLPAGATLQANFGSGIGGNDLGVYSWTNPTSNDVNGRVGNMPAINIPASLTEFFVTLVYVDGNYGASSLHLSYIDGDAEPTIDGTIVPLPAAMPLFAAGFAFFGMLRRQRRKITAAQ